MSTWGRKRIRPILQDESNECILACVAMIAQYHGGTRKLRDLRANFSRFGRGGSLRDLMDVAQAVHLAPRPLKVDIESLQHLTLPCVVHWNFDHFVILERLGSRGVRLVDPARGVVELSLEAFSRRFTGIAVEFRPRPSFPKQTDGPSSAPPREPDFISVRPYVRSIALFAAIAAASLALQLVAPLSIQLVVDRVLPTSDYDLLTLIAIGFLAVQLLSAFANYVQSRFVMRASARLRLSTIYEFNQNLLNNGLNYFNSRGLGHFVAQYNSITFLVNHVVHDVGAALVDLIYIALVVCILLFMSAETAAVVVVISVLVVTLRWLLMTRSRELQNDVVVATAREESYFVETLRGIYSVKANRLEQLRTLGGVERAINAINDGFAARSFELHFTVLVQVVKAAESILILYLLARQVLAGSMTIGVMYTFYMYRVFVDQRLANYMDTMANILNIRVHQNRLAESLQMGEPDTRDTDVSGFLKFGGRVELKDVSYHIDNGRRYLLRDYCNAAPARSFVHISGPSGVGKSTLLKILLSIVEPDTGEVLIDGRQVGSYSTSMLKNNVGVVLQEDTLFAGSIMSNVSAFDERLDLAQVQRCCQLCEIDDEIRGFPLGYHSLVGDMGANLSSGQQQRLLLARALYKNPTILILDEATANLDAEIERRILRNLKALGKTIIFASHSAIVPEFRDREWPLGDQPSPQVGVMRVPVIGRVQPNVALKA